MKKLFSFVLSSTLAAALAAPMFAQATQTTTGAAQSTATTTTQETKKEARKAARDAKKAANNTAAKVATVAPTTQEIADAQSKGMVWANTATKVYHTSGEYYGHTKHGKFMTKDEAEKAGYHLAKEGVAKKKATTTAPVTK